MRRHDGDGVDRSSGDIVLLVPRRERGDDLILDLKSNLMSSFIERQKRDLYKIFVEAASVTALVPRCWT